ncbi:MAG: RNA methyltransferase, partial [Candidatus Riflebacteria bacterium]
MGSTFRLPAYDQIDIDNLFELLQKFEFTKICAHMSGQKLTEFSFPDRTALFLGNEGQGVAEKIKKVCAMKLAIPMYGQVESLNVATSAAICLYEWAKQHQKVLKA